MSPASPKSRFVAAVPWAWLAALAVVSLLSLGTYAGVQQTLRTGANDPQVQLAEDAAARLAAGEDPAAVVPAGHIDIARSLAPWAAVVSPGSGVVTTSGNLDGDVPHPPTGVLKHAAREGENRVTWMPRPGVRIALVVVPVAGRENMLVLSGRSLREVEARVDRIGQMCLLAWGAAMGVVVCAWGLTEWGRRSARTA